MRRTLRELWRSEAGVTALEYALIASLIAVVIVTSLIAVSNGVGGLYQRVADCVASPADC